MKIKEDESLNYYRRINIPSGDLRISIIADCNMRCHYCHNEGQGDFSPAKLSLEDIRKIVAIGRHFGINKVRLTGGEPLIHPDIVPIVAMLRNEFSINNIGINTNGTLLGDNMVNDLISSGLAVAVVGLDYFSSNISKASKIGYSPEEILKNVLNASNKKLQVQIACVYSADNHDDIFKLIEWCINKKILIKIIEVNKSSICKSTSKKFEYLVGEIISYFRLRVGKTISLNEYYGLHHTGVKILFFHAKCRIRECYECSQMHLRVTAKGKAKPCILRKDTEFDLLGNNSLEEMAKAVHNLGIPPEEPRR